MAKSNAIQHIQASQTVTIVTAAGLSAPANEAQARELLPLKDQPDQMTEAWVEANEKYAQAIEATGYELATLNNFAWVSTQIPKSLRAERLSWTHHREVAALDPPSQSKWLGRALVAS